MSWTSFGERLGDGLAREALSGSAAGVVGTVLGYPLDVIKTRMQNSRGALSITASIRAIYLESGIMGFYRGVVSPLLALTILNTMNFTSYTYFCGKLGVSNSSAGHNRSHHETGFGKQFEWRYGVAAGCAGPIAALVSTPFELVKIQCQKQSAAPISTMMMTYRILRDHGIKYGLYQGHGINTVREIVFLVAYFTTYENIKHYIQAHISSFAGLTSSVNSAAVPIAGGLSGAVGWLISFPLDNIKSNIQSRTLGKGQYRPSAMELARELIRSKGLLGLYAGILPSILRAFIVSATRFSVYESTMQLLGE